jgi:ABC-2 type transport system ATP-binding protein
MLEVRNLTKYYKRLCAVDNLTFEVRPGEIVGLLGPNGAGKTTVLRCIAGILRSNSGLIRLCGHDLALEQRAAKQSLAFVPETPSLYELLTVREHLRFTAMCFDTLDVYERVSTDLLARYDLLEKENELVATLSKGMKQKLAVACAMVHDAHVFLLDEPLIGIDPRGQAELKRQFTEAAAAGAAVLVSTHLLDTAERLCSRVVIMNRGQKIEDGTLDELRARSESVGDATLEDVFLKLTEEADEAPAVLDV